MPGGRNLIGVLAGSVVAACGVHAAAAKQWPDPPAWWDRAAACVHSYESSDWHQRGYFSGGYQFLDSTWHAVHGRGRAADASPAEQTWRAWLLYQQVGWAAWPSTSRLCGLR